MEYETALALILTEGSAIDGIVVSVRMGKIPDTDRMLPLLDALKCVFQHLQGAAQIDRDSASSLFALTFHVQGEIDGRIARGIQTPDGFLSNKMVQMFLLVESIYEDESMF